MRRLFIVMLVLIVLLVGGDLLLRAFAEDRAGEQVRSSLELRAEPEVSFGGWPFTPSALRGRFDSVHIVIDRVTARGVTIEDVDASFTNVRVSIGDILEGSADAVRSDGGEGRATLSSRALNRIAREAGAGADVRLRDDSVVVETPQGSVEGNASLDGNTLTVAAEGLPQDLSFELPQVVDGLRYESLRVTDGVAVLSFTLEAGVLRAPQ